MRVIGAALMGAGCWVILASPDLSGFTLLGAIVFALGLLVAQSAQADIDRRDAPRDSTAAALDAAAQGMVDDV